MAEDTQEVSALITESPEVIPLPKRATRRRNKTAETALDADEIELQPPPDIENTNPTPRKRGRKKKVVEEEPDASSTLEDTANNVSVDVPTTTKRRRKKLETTSLYICRTKLDCRSVLTAF